MAPHSLGRTQVPLRAILGFTLYVLLNPLVLFGTAGRWDWLSGWVYTILLLIAVVGSRLVVLRTNPDLLHERGRFTQAEGTPAWDRLLSQVVGLWGPLLVLFVAGLDERYGWSGGIPPLGQAVAAVVIALAYLLASWAMIVNPYFSAVARLQGDRGQVVVSAGPYRWVRHPAYAGGLWSALATPLLFDAPWGLLPALLMVAALVTRTALEDRLLIHGLSGYAQYSKKTRYRLMPGVW